MNAPTPPDTLPPQPASLQRAEARARSLDERIAVAEQRLIAREEGLRRRVAGLGRRARAQLQPRRLLLPVAAALAGIGALSWWLVSGRRGAPPRRWHDADDSAAPPPVPWVRYIGMAWPLVPQHLRARVSPATASAVLTVGLPLLERVLGMLRRRRHARR